MIRPAHHSSHYTKILYSVSCRSIPEIMISIHEILREYKFCEGKIVQELDAYLQKHLSEHRYNHTLLTVSSALKLALYNKITDHDEICNLVIAALSHDITKEQPEEFHRDIFLKHNIPDSLKIPAALYHSRSGPYFLAEKFGIDNPQIRHAIFFHSTGCEQMPVFSRILFCADYMASGFMKDSMLDAETNLRDICLDKISTTIHYLVTKKMPVQHESINFYNILIDESKYEKENRNA